MEWFELHLQVLQFTVKTHWWMLYKKFHWFDWRLGNILPIQVMLYLINKLKPLILYHTFLFFFGGFFEFLMTKLLFQAIHTCHAVLYRKYRQLYRGSAMDCWQTDENYTRGGGEELSHDSWSLLSRARELRGWWGHVLCEGLGSVIVRRGRHGKWSNVHVSNPIFSLRRAF